MFDPLAIDFHKIVFPVVISGPSGVGKTLLVDRLLAGDRSLVESISATSRPVRAGEKHGVHYYFYDEKRFRTLIDEGGLLEWARVHEHYYGTPRVPLEENLSAGRSVLLNIDVQGARQLKTARPDAVLVFILPPSMEVLESRLRNRRTDTEPNIRTRLANAWKEMEAAAYYDYCVVNGDIDEATSELVSVITAEKRRVSRLRRE